MLPKLIFSKKHKKHEKITSKNSKNTVETWSPAPGTTSFSTNTKKKNRLNGIPNGPILKGFVTISHKIIKNHYRIGRSAAAERPLRGRGAAGPGPRAQGPGGSGPKAKAQGDQGPGGSGPKAQGPGQSTWRQPYPWRIRFYPSRPYPVFIRRLASGWPEAGGWPPAGWRPASGRPEADLQPA